MLAILIALLVIPAVAGIACYAAPARAAAAITIASGAACLALVLAAVPDLAHGAVDYGAYLRADAVSGVFLVTAGFLYAVVAIYAAGYHKARPARYLRRFYLGFNLFAWAMLAAPLMGSLTLLWIAVEVTTVVSALLVALEGHDGAAEAAWKYVLIASAGLALALLATMFAYYAGAQVLGEHFSLGFAQLAGAGSRLPATPVRMAFGLAVIGYGTKAGLVPVHTWLPDAHSEASTPVSALLSGALLATSFYAILRFYQVAVAAVGGGFPRDTLLAFGVASLALAALCMTGQRDLKRLLAYSSVEHMGILAAGVAFGAPVALAGVMLHVLAHGAAKASAFMSAGVFTVKYRGKQLAVMRDGLRLLPASGPLFGLAILGLSAFPPSGIFRSEFQIVAGGLGSGSYAAAAALVLLVTLAFFGLATSATSVLLLPARPAAPGLPEGASHASGSRAAPEGDATGADGASAAGQAGGARQPALAFAAPRVAAAAAALAPGEPSRAMVLAPLIALGALAVLGIHPPGDLATLITQAATQLRGTP